MVLIAFVASECPKHHVRSFSLASMCGSRGGGGGGVGVSDPLKNYINIGFPINTVLDPLKLQSYQARHSMLGDHWHTSETPFKWHFAGGPMMARFELYFWILPPPPSSTKRKIFLKVGPPLTKNFWILAWPGCSTLVYKMLRPELINGGYPEVRWSLWVGIVQIFIKNTI